MIITPPKTPQGLPSTQAQLRDSQCIIHGEVTPSCLCFSRLSSATSMSRNAMVGCRYSPRATGPRGDTTGSSPDDCLGAGLDTTLRVVGGTLVLRVSPIPPDSTYQYRTATTSIGQRSIRYCRPDIFSSNLKAKLRPTLHWPETVKNPKARSGCCVFHFPRRYSRPISIFRSKPSFSC